jgi:hypothetical protein
MLCWKPFQAFPGQDHQAHITAHLNFMETNMVKNAPAVMCCNTKKYTRTHKFNVTRAS